MRFVFLIQAIAALGIAGCQIPPPVATAPQDATPAAIPAATPAPKTDTLASAASGDDTLSDTDVDALTTDDSDRSAAAEPAAEITTPEIAMAETVEADRDMPTTPEPEPAEPGSKSEPAAETPPPGDDPDAPAPMVTEMVLESDMADPPADGDRAAEVIAPADVAPLAPTPEDDTPSAPVSTVTGEIDADTDPQDAEPSAEDGTATTELALVAPPPPPPPSPPPPELAPQALVGLDTPGLRARLGEADFKRREGPVETWQYRFRTCVIDYFIQAGDAGPTVRGWAWRSPVIGSALDAETCRRALAGRDRDS